jgi:hypothetical protein
VSRLSIIERVALLAVAFSIFASAFAIDPDAGWWRWPASIALVLLAGAIVGAVVLVTASQSRDRSAGEEGGSDDA